MRLHYVPAGSFVMGSDSGWPGVGPAHEVRLEGNWIDETEVTNGTYALCAEAGGCTAPADLSSYTRERYFLDAAYADFPVLHLSWQDADRYCSWAGRALPTDAQWEKAARGTDERLYPWGDQAPNEGLLNSFDVSFLEDTVQGGSYPRGASPYSALDMGGKSLGVDGGVVQPVSRRGSDGLRQLRSGLPGHARRFIRGFRRCHHSVCERP
jgi:formylglycine-generating enzyme required for sulfatase activity